MKNTILYLIASLSLLACSNKTEESKAYGNFEAIETIVSAESSGKILNFIPTEGDILNKGQHVATTDTTMIYLQLSELAQQELVNSSKIKNIRAQLAILEQQLANQKINKQRVKKLHETGAATQKQLDDINGLLAISKKQIKANNTQSELVESELLIIAAKKKLLKQQLANCYITNPKKGTLLEKYAETGEMTAPGKPLYKLADLENLTLKAYISGSMLSTVGIGNSCQVYIDAGKEELIPYTGTISWISSQSEFTPKIIQTQEERVNLVYAVKISVKNNGKIKIGMPGEVIF